LRRLAFQLDLGFYYLGVASQPYKRGAGALAEPPYSTKPSIPFFLMRLYNRRFARMARARRRRDAWGLHNNSRRYLIPGFTFSPISSMPIVKAIFSWAGLELTEGWRSWFDTKPKPRTEIQPAAVLVTR
jgi:hypothetical protein